MKVEILYFDGCPSYREAQATLEEVLYKGDVTAEVRLVAVNTDEEAQRLRFPGSPTLRVDGEDLFSVPDRARYALGCRMYATPEGLWGRPRPRCFGRRWRSGTAEAKKSAEKGSSSEAVLCRVYIPPSIESGSKSVMADQKDVVVYVCRHSWRCWLISRFLGRRGYRFEVIDATNDSRLRSWLAHLTGREKMPCVYIDHRPVGGLSEIRALERSGTLEYLVRGGV